MSTPAATAVPLHPLVADRWSPRAYDATRDLTERHLVALLEAARWAPSAMNRQPWRFLVGRRGDETFKGIYDALAPGNQLWAGNAGALIVAVAQVAGADGNPLGNTAFEVGLAVAQLTVQAHADGLYVHQMGGFSGDAVRTAFDVPAGFEPVVTLAVGHRGDIDLLDEPLRSREVAPRSRRALPEIAYAGSWGEPAVA